MQHVPALALLIALLLGHAAPAAATERVDLELVIATDVSRSIDEGEARLQREGVAAAFLDEAVIGAIRSGPLGRIAVAYIDYSSRPFNRVIVDWRVIRDRASANGFAESLLKSDLTYGRRTSISDAIEHGVDLIEGNAFQGTRRVIDVSGDGPNNHGNLVSDVRDAAVAKGIVINGLPIMNDPGVPFRSRYYLPDLDKYYAGCVIGGSGAFQVPARDFKDFARAIKKKLILEIAGLAPPADQPGPRLIRAASKAATRPPMAGPGYRLGCDIGEKMRYRAWGGIDDP
ncbi:MAG: DUF1194 domain-containing protein [Alphaproteobacteria bacterium]|nr:DUF1194 domain-containing protein [Alphaproteobacteria bacterium]